jgi:hypothetical protein
VGVILLRNYLQAFRGGTGGREGGGNEGRGGRPVVVWVYDVEVGWKEAVSETTRCLKSWGTLQIRPGLLRKVRLHSGAGSS